MNAQLRKKRGLSADSSPVITKTDQGYRVESPFDPNKRYLVTVTDGRLHCTCSDFQIKKSDPEYICRHIAAVIEYDNQALEPDEVEDDLDESSPPEVYDEIREAWDDESRPDESYFGRNPDSQHWSQSSDPGKEPTITMSPAHMLIKRSLSPDGRINSISIELDFPVDPDQTDEVKAKARTALQLQTDIVREYIYWEEPDIPNIPQPSNVAPLRPEPIGPVKEPALLKDIGSMKTANGDGASLSMSRLPVRL